MSQRQSVPRSPSTNNTQSTLDNLMMGYADMSGGNKGLGGASAFKGPALKDVKIAKSSGPSFKPSQKSRDWSTLAQNLEDAFVIAPTPTVSIKNTIPMISQNVPNAANVPRVFHPQTMGMVAPPPNETQDEWGDFQDFSIPPQTQQMPNIPNSTAHSTMLSSPFVQSVTTPNQKPLQPFLPQTETKVTPATDDDFADFVAAPVTQANTSSVPLPGSSSINANPLPHLLPAPRATFKTQATNMSSGNTQKPVELLPLRTIGSRLATFQDESPVHRFKCSDSPTKEGLPVGPKSAQTDEDDDFGEFTSTSFPVTFNTAISAVPRLSNDNPTSVVASMTSSTGGLPALAAANILSANIPTIPVVHMQETVLKPFCAGGDKYGALRDVFADDSINSENKNTNTSFKTQAREKQVDASKEIQMGSLIKDISSFEGVDNKPKVLLSGLVPSGVPSTSSSITTIPSVTNVNLATATDIEDDEDFGDFIAGRKEEKTTAELNPPLPISNPTVFPSSDTTETNKSTMEHLRTDTFFMPQKTTMPCNNAGDNFPIWHDSEPPPMMEDPQEMESDNQVATAGHDGAVGDDFFGGFEDVDASNDVIDIDDVASTTSHGVLDEDEHFNGFESKPGQRGDEYTDNSLKVPPAPRKNSVSSLDLRMGSTSPEETAMNEDGQNTNSQKDCTADRYRGFTYFIQEAESPGNTHSHLRSPLREWLACLNEILILISQAADAFTYIPSDTVLEEVIESKEGSNYIKNIVEIYRVYKRIQLSHDKLIEHQENTKDNHQRANEMIDKGEKIDQAWKQLTINLNGKSILPEKSVFNFAQCLVKQIGDNNGILNFDLTNDILFDMCGLCLLSLSQSNADMRPAENEKGNVEVLESILSHGSRRYHSTCANFWVNRVDFVLPTLTPQFN